MSDPLSTLTVRDLMAELGVSDPTARRILKQIGFRIGWRYRCTREALDRWLRSREGLARRPKLAPPTQPTTADSTPPLPPEP